MTTKPISRFKAATTLTISGGAISIVQGVHVVAAEAGVTDDLDTINNGIFNTELFLMADSGDTITIKDGTGNIETGDGNDVDLDGDKVAHLLYDVGNTVWKIVAVSVTGGSSGGSQTLDTYELNSGDTISPSTHANSLILLGTLGAPSELTFDTLSAGDDGKFFYINNKARGTSDQRLHLHPPSGVSIWKMSDGITLWENASVLLIYDHTNTTLRLVAATGGIVTKLGVVTYFEGQWEGVYDDGNSIYRPDDLGLNTYFATQINDTSPHVRTVRNASFQSGGSRPPSMQFESNNGNRIYAVDSPLWDVLNQDVIDGNQDMCIHVWFNADNTTSRRIFVSHFEDSDNYWEFAMNDGDLYFRRKYSGSFDITLTWTTTISPDVSHHAIAAVIGGKLALYFDGTQRAYLDLSGETAHNFSGELAWGALGDSTTGAYRGELWDFGIAYGNPFGLDPQSDNSDTYTTNERKIGVLNGYR